MLAVGKEEGRGYGLLHVLVRITTNHIHGRMPPWVPGRGRRVSVGRDMHARAGTRVQLQLQLLLLLLSLHVSNLLA
jgi:hypothetical protein